MNKLLVSFYGWLKKYGLGRSKKEWPSRQARIWSNQELKKFSNLFSGKVINVSAWKDEDKQGGYYKNYFIKAKSYEISNYDGWRGDNTKLSGYTIDLEKEIDPGLVRVFDVVFNHTTLEHIFLVSEAFKNLCLLSKDIAIIVVPFVQRLHGPQDGDFWRLSPYCVRRLFQQNGYSVIYESASSSCDVIYLFFIATRHPENWSDIIQSKTIEQESVSEYYVERRI